MGLDASFHIIYGFRVENRKFTDAVQKYMDDNYTLPNGKDYDTYIEDIECVSGGLKIVSDYMCGEYQYVGYQTYEEHPEYGEDFFIELSPNEIADKCDITVLDNLMKAAFPFMVGNEYSDNKLFGIEPKLYIVKRVW